MAGAPKVGSSSIGLGAATISASSARGLAAPSSGENRNGLVNDGASKVGKENFGAENDGILNVAAPSFNFPMHRLQLEPVGKVSLTLRRRRRFALGFFVVSLSFLSF